MIGNHRNGDAGLVIFVIQEVFNEFPGFTAQPHPHASNPRIGAVDGLYNGVVDSRISLGRHAVFAIDFVENFPIIDLVVMVGVVALPEFIRESALRVPTHQARVVIPHFLQTGIAELRSLLVVPGYLVGIAGISHGLIGLEHPGGNRAEIDDYRVPGLGIHQVFHHGVDQREVPGSLAILGRFEFGNTELGVRQPRHVANEISSQLMQSLKDTIMYLRAPPQRWIDDHLKGGSCLRNSYNLVPLDSYADLLRCNRLRHGIFQAASGQEHDCGCS